MTNRLNQGKAATRLGVDQGQASSTHDQSRLRHQNWHLDFRIGALPPTRRGREEEVQGEESSSGTENSFLGERRRRIRAPPGWSQPSPPLLWLLTCVTSCSNLEDSDPHCGVGLEEGHLGVGRKAALFCTGGIQVRFFHESSGRLHGTAREEGV